MGVRKVADRLMNYKDLGEVLLLYFDAYFHTEAFTFHLGMKVNTEKTEI